ncbi:hypothetical protein ACA910_021984 [Epithemia clementina (nom. ined.)]
MSHPFDRQTFHNNSILANATGVVVPPTARLSLDAQAALAASRGPAGASYLRGSPTALGAASAAALAAEEQRILLAQARARASHAAAQNQRDDELLLRLLHQQNQIRREPAMNFSSLNQFSSLPPGATFAHIPGVTSFYGTPGPGLLAQGPNASSFLNSINAARLQQAQRELQQMDRNAVLLEEARARQGLRTLAYIHPQTGLAIPASGAGQAGIAALQGLQLQTRPPPNLDPRVASATAELPISAPSTVAATNSESRTERDLSSTQTEPHDDDGKKKKKKKKKVRPSQEQESNEKPRRLSSCARPEAIVSAAQSSHERDGRRASQTIHESMASFAAPAAAPSQMKSSHAATAARASSSASVNSTDSSKADETSEVLEDTTGLLAGNDPEAPKRPMSAFLAFSNKRRKSLKRQYPCASNADLSKMLAKTWREAPDVIREKYINEAAALSEQYKADISQWRKGKKKRKHDNSCSGEDPGSVHAKCLKKEEDDEDRGDSKKRAVADEDDESAQLPEEAHESAASENSGISKTIAHQIFALFEKNDWDALTLATRVVDLCRIYDWSEVETALFECYDECRARDRYSMEHIVNRAEALDVLRSKIPVASMDGYREELVGDFVKSLELLLNSNNEGASSDVPFQNLEGIEVVVRMLLELGTGVIFSRIEEWASKAPLRQLSALNNLFEIVNPDIALSDCRNNVARGQCVNTVAIRYKAFKIDDLKSQREELIEATQGCEPRFSWSMPKAATDSHALNAFLHSNRKGPETIVVGGGRDCARRLARRFRFHGENRESRQQMLRAGFSAIIQNTGQSGENAAVTVTKTKDLYAAELKQYRQNMVKLRNVCVELRRLGVHVVLLGTAETEQVEPVAGNRGGEEERF